MFNAIGNTADITTPLVIGSFHDALVSLVSLVSLVFVVFLVFVGLHGLAAVMSYWLTVGRIERFTVPRRGAQGAATAGTATSVC